jgi:predicted nuclease of predicted toxin-antitoxin system
VVLTHDNDFGWLILVQEQPYIGVVYLRPGHILAKSTIETLQTIQARAIEVNPPFILVAERSENTIRMRVRQS